MASSSLLLGATLLLIATTALAQPSPRPPPRSPAPPRSPPPSPYPPPAPASYCYKTCTPNDLGGYLKPQPADPCNIGPSYWCLPGNMEKCNVEWQTMIGMCKYSNNKCPTASMGDVCKDPLALKWPGGLTNITPGRYGYLAVALYWAPSSCTSNQTTGGGYCSRFTTKGRPGAKTLQLHGVWPDFGSFYGNPPSQADNPTFPLYAGSYQGWSQYCRATDRPGAIDYSKCHVNGGLCPEVANDQFTYEACMRKYNITDCMVEESVVTALYNDFEQYGAGYLGDDRTFLDHEFFKHGSCMGGYMTDSKLAYFTKAMEITKFLRGPSSEGQAARTVHLFRGRSISSGRITGALKRTGVPRCNAKCQLTEIWYCYGRDAAGNPTNLITCPAGTLASDNCSPGIPFSRNCTEIIIPDFEVGPNLVA